MEAKKALQSSLKNLKSRLYHGAITEIHRDTGFSRTHIYDVLNGLYFNEVIIKAAKQKIKEHEQRVERRINQYRQFIEA